MQNQNLTNKTEDLLKLLRKHNSSPLGTVIGFLNDSTTDSIRIDQLLKLLKKESATTFNFLENTSHHPAIQRLPVYDQISVYKGAIRIMQPIGMIRSLCANLQESNGSIPEPAQQILVGLSGAIQCSNMPTSEFVERVQGAFQANRTVGCSQLITSIDTIIGSYQGKKKETLAEIGKRIAGTYIAERLKNDASEEVVTMLTFESVGMYLQYFSTKQAFDANSAELIRKYNMLVFKALQQKADMYSVLGMRDEVLKCFV